MQYKKDLLYKRILELSPELNSTEYIKDIINEIVNGIKEWSKNPNDIILNVKHLGRFYWKYKNLKRDLEAKKDFTDANKYKRGEEHERFVDVANAVLDMYDDYHTEKYRIRKLNYGSDYKEPEELIKLKQEFLNKKRNDKKLI